jgi:hypothetical protein
VVDGAHPAPLVPLETVKEYTDVTVGVAVGFSAVVDDRDGPLQLNKDAPSAGLAVSVTVLFKQIGPPFVGLAEGALVTEAIVV